MNDETRAPDSPKPYDLRILVVEDEAAIAFYFEDLLIDLGCRVVKASRVEAGLEFATTLALDGAFLDVNVFGQSVYPLMQALRAREVPFALVTGHDARHLPPEYRGCRILGKPIDEEKFTDMVAGFAVRARGLE